MAFSQLVPFSKTKNLKVKPLRFSTGDIATSLAVNTAVASVAHLKGQKSLTSGGLFNAWILGNILLTFGGLKRKSRYC